MSCRGFFRPSSVIEIRRRSSFVLLTGFSGTFESAHDVDDVLICHAGPAQGSKAASQLHERFPFGTWMQVSEQPSGVTYCGKEIQLVRKDGKDCVVLSQNAFVDGRLQPMRIDPSRTKDVDARATEAEATDYRSVIGSLQWLTAQSRPDLAFECNQLQKRSVDLRVRDLQRANRAVKEAVKNRFEIVFRPIGHDAEILAFHDAGLYT